MESNPSIYWLDSLFLANTRHSKLENTLESQMNKLSRLIVLSFPIFALYIPIKNALAIIISMLFVVSTLYYYLIEKFSLKENYEEKVRDSRRTFIGDLDYHIDERQREIYIPRRQMHQVVYRTIVPLESIASLQLSDKDSVGNPEVLKKIKPMENLYSQREDGQNSQETSFLTFNKGTGNNTSRSQLLLDDTEIFRRTNIDHLNLNPNKPITNFQEIDNIYMNDMLQQRTNYEKQISDLNRVKDEHNKIAPIHQNFRVQGYGGPSFVANYRGPRGQM